MTEGEQLLNGAGPFETIYDFYGFPDELFDITYSPEPAAGVAASAAALLKPSPEIIPRRAPAITPSAGPWRRCAKTAYLYWAAAISCTTSAS
jgi:aromatic ring-opening dioxygenase catalytic subunit (LigB family)